MKPRCFFCGRLLEESKAGGRWVCPGCKASFIGRTDPDGCIIALEVDHCGTPDCCQFHPPFNA